MTEAMRHAIETGRGMPGNLTAAFISAADVPLLATRLRSSATSTPAVMCGSGSLRRGSCLRGSARARPT